MVKDVKNPPAFSTVLTLPIADTLQPQKYKTHHYGDIPVSCILTASKEMEGAIMYEN
jgi:hypothetical protein